MITSLSSKGVVHQYMAAITGAVSFLMSGQSTSWPSPILPRIMAHETPVYLDISQICWMVSIMYIGTMASPIFSGYLMDKFGRKRTLIYGVSLQLSSWLLILFAKSASVLYLGRFLAGLFWGLASTIEPVYVGEVAQTHIRGSLGFLNNFLYHVGNLITFIIGPYTSYDGLAIMSMLPLIIFLITFSFMPESPYYFIIKDKEELAKKSLSWLRDKNNNTELETEINFIKATVKEDLKNKGHFKDIFGTKASRKAFIISESFGVIKRLSGNVLYITFATVTLPKLTFNFLNVSECVIIISIIEVIASFIAVFLADKFKLRTLLAISCSGCSIAMFVSAIWYYLDTNTTVDVKSFNFIPFITFTLHAIFHCLSLGPVSNTFKGELYPTNFKGKISSIMVTTSSFASFLIYRYFLIIAYDIGMYLNFIIFGITCFIGLLITILYLPEIRGKNFQEIQDILGGKKKSNSSNCAPVPSNII